VSGLLEGGWEFVTLAYSVSALVLGGYAISVFVRFRSETARRKREARRAVEVTR
jgi:ATP-dependent helicase YprA (DUF1998 family)